MIKATDYIGSLVIENDTLQFIQTAEGRVVPKDNRWEYQYFLKDHLGNVRTTFTTRPKTETYSTSFETDSVPDGYFDYYPNNATRDNYTARTGAYSSRLSYSGDSTLIGLAKSLKVYPGDTVKATAYARMLDNSTEDINDLFIALGKGFASAFATTTFGIEGQVESFPNLVYPPSGTGDLLGKDQNDATPKLYLNLLYFDKDMNFITGDFARTSAAATTSFEELSLEVLVPMEGYLLIYVSNEENQANIAYFDDVSITHHHSPVLQADDYYPFGLSFNSYQRSYSKANNYKYNGVELNPTTQIYETLFRGYDPALGRFMQIDPLADFMPGINPYSFGFNNPISFSDPTGLAPQWWAKLMAGLDRIGNILKGDFNKPGRYDKNGTTAGTGNGRRRNNSGGSSNSNSTTPTNSYAEVSGIDMPSSSFAEFNAPLSTPKIIDYHKRPVPRNVFEFEDEIYRGEAGTSFEYNKSIFDINKPSLSDRGKYQFAGDLKDLVKYIISKPDLKLSVVVGTAMSEKMAKSSENPNAGESNFNFYNARGQAIYKALYEMGIPLNQLKLTPVDWGSNKRVDLKLVE